MPASFSLSSLLVSALFLALVVFSSVATADDQLLCITNQERKKNGLRALAKSSQLDAAAYQHACDMCGAAGLSHDGSDGSTPWQRFQNAGFQLTSGGENIASGFHDARTVHEAFMGDQGHRDNILGDWTYMGSASCGGCWSEEFANSDSVPSGSYYLNC